MKHRLTRQQLLAHMAGDLQVKWLQSGSTFRVHYGEHIDMHRNLYPLDTLIFTIEDSEPIEWVLLLNPMSAVNQLVMHEGQRRSVIEEVYNCSGMAGGYVTVVTSQKVVIKQRTQDDIDIEDIVIHLLKPQCNMAWVNDILLEWGFDVYSLIGKGLAEELVR